MQNTKATRRVIYVDVDDTLVRSVGQKRIPMPGTVEYVRALKKQGADLYCWSSGGADYAQRSAIELGISDCFTAFLPKPQVMIDDQLISEWRGLLFLHPLSLPSLPQEADEKNDEEAV